ncbi:toll/interleukin-1 receptor domain-containing protein [Enterobacter roggenkampii]
MASIFLSHNSADKPFVRRLAQSLQSQGHVVWLGKVRISRSFLPKLTR